jgi:hypothetical protein
LQNVFLQLTSATICFGCSGAVKKGSSVPGFGLLFTAVGETLDFKEARGVKLQLQRVGERLDEDHVLELARALTLAFAEHIRVGLGKPVYPADDPSMLDRLMRQAQRLKQRAADGARDVWDSLLASPVSNDTRRLAEKHLRFVLQQLFEGKCLAALGIGASPVPLLLAAVAANWPNLWKPVAVPGAAPVKASLAAGSAAGSAASSAGSAATVAPAFAPASATVVATLVPAGPATQSASGSAAGSAAEVDLASFASIRAHSALAQALADLADEVTEMKALHKPQSPHEPRSPQRAVETKRQAIALTQGSGASCELVPGDADPAQSLQDAVQVCSRLPLCRAHSGFHQMDAMRKHVDIMTTELLLVKEKVTKIEVVEEALSPAGDRSSRQLEVQLAAMKAELAREREVQARERAEQAREREEQAREREAQRLKDEQHRREMEEMKRAVAVLTAAATAAAQKKA